MATLVLEGRQGGALQKEDNIPGVAQSSPKLTGTISYSAYSNMLQRQDGQSWFRGVAVGQSIAL
jgi:hypothetical protein